MVGTWKVYDPTGAGAVQGQVTLEWLDGGFFLLQRVDLDNSRGMEIIGYDEASRTLKSYFFSETGQILEYEYEMDDDTLIVSIDTPHTKGEFVGTLSDDGNSYSGSWEWSQNGVPMGYDATMTRVK
jgi:hypothetical protein